MNTDLHALIMDMANQLDFNRQCLMNNRSLTHPLADRARAALAAEPEGAPASPAGLAVRPLLEMVMGVGISTTLGQIHTIQDQIRGWLDANPPGACSCVEVPPPAPVPKPPVDEGLIERLTLISDGMSAVGHESDSWFVARAAVLLQQLSAPPPAPVPVAERLPEAGDCDDQGTCWCFHGTAFTWGLFQFDLTAHTHWLPHWALPIPPKTQP